MTSVSTDAASMPIICRYIPEPLLEFGDGGLHIDPKSGIARYGPLSYNMVHRHPATVSVGMIGTADTTTAARQWMETAANGLRGNAKHPEFPGYKRDRGFLSELEFDDGWVELISKTELRKLVETHKTRERFEETLNLLDDKLRLLAELDQPPRYVVVALPQQLLDKCRAVDYHDRDLGLVHRDLRRAIKASAMRYQLPTQLLSERVTGGKDKDVPCKIAWNYFTGLYTKAGGMPWGPTGLTPGTCYVGISFYRPLGSKKSILQTSLAQAFDEHGEGLGLRGHEFEWDPGEKGTGSPHLPADKAHELIDLVLTRYRKEMKQTPQRVVVHKTSRYWPDERAGFIGALQDRVDRFDLLALAPQSAFRLITVSKYPPLRGTWFSVGELDFLYSTGFLADLGEYHSLHVPSPLRIADHIGQDTPRDMLLREVLILTKLNWNSAHFAGALPITLHFAHLVGEIMREIPPEREPMPQYKYYM